MNDPRLSTLTGRARSAGASPAQLDQLADAWAGATEPERLQFMRAGTTASFRRGLAAAASDHPYDDSAPPDDTTVPENPPAGAEAVIAWASQNPTAARLEQAWEAELARPKGPRVTVRAALAALGHPVT